MKQLARTSSYGRGVCCPSTTSWTDSKTYISQRVPTHQTRAPCWVKLRLQFVLNFLGVTLRLATTMLFVNTRVDSGKSAITGRFSAFSYIICRLFKHVNLGAPLFERNLVHRQLYQVDAAPMLGFEIID